MTTTSLDVDPDLVAFYTHDVDDRRRLSSTARGRLEATRVRKPLARRLSDPVADAGGGPGVHARSLAGVGYAVDLIDPIPRHVKASRQPGLRSAQIGDACALPWSDELYGLVSLAGPLYHLPVERRKRALSEAVRVTRPGGTVAEVAANRYANLIGSAVANQYQQRRRVVAEILADGYSARNDRVRHMDYRTRDGLEADLDAAGLVEVRGQGLSGPGGWLTVAVKRHLDETGTPRPASLVDPDPSHTALQVARVADDYPDLTPLSAQLIGSAGADDRR